jgi:maltooligosyltrehalose trehalohydrolase
MTTAPRFGPRLEPDRGVTFRLWAPAAKQVEIVLDKPFPMQPSGDGWYECRVHDARVGSRYRFRIDGEMEVPDPASHFQPADLQSPSEIIDHRYDWQCTDWKGRPWNEAVILELHVGTFTKVGTFRGVIDRLDNLVQTGITAVELMPLADFAGRWNWGYDGVLLYAPDSAYGRPEDLKALIDAAHAHGLMVLLDVVYNHFGPEGNYLSRYAPQFFTSRHKTPWGDAIDYRVPEVRAFAIENAVHWLDNYRFDGLRLDAVHAIAEPGEPHILHDLSRAVGELAAATGRTIHLVLENDDNRASLLDPAAEVPSGKYRAQWNDDYHHAWHVLLTGETGGYYGDYAEDPMGAVARAVGQGFVYQGQVSQHRGGARRGEPSQTLPPSAFVNFLQNHDQIGNRAYGDRLTALAPAAGIEAALAVTLLAPSPPLLFMGEEWGTTQPFPFFCDFKGDLAEAVRKGRRSEFQAAFANVEDVGTIPDPLTEATFRSAVLDWNAREREPHASRLSLVRSLLAARREHIVPLIGAIVPGSGKARVADGVLQASWRLEDGSALKLLANLTAKDAPPGARPNVTAAIWGGEVGDRLQPWSVYWWLGAR